jgi:hypothetical protein
MNYEKDKHIDAGEPIEGDAIYVSHRRFPNDRLVMGTLYVQSPEEFRQRMGELAKRIGYPEGAVINSVWKFGQHPRRKGESPTTYAKRLAKLPDPPAIFVTSNEFLH